MLDGKDSNATTNEGVAGQERNGEVENTSKDLNLENEGEVSPKQEVKKEETPEIKEEIKDEAFETAKDSTGGKFDTLTLVQEVAKYEAKIENLKGNSVDEKVFYKDLNKHLTDAELQLRFEDDQSLYIEAVNAAKTKWLKENSVDTSKEEESLERAKESLVIAKSIDTVLKDPAHKDFNFVKLQDFYLNDLTKKEQLEIDKGSSKDNLPEYFKKLHNEYKKRNPKNVKNVEAPNIPDASNASKTSVEDASQIEKEANNKKYREKIGFRKL